MPVSTGSHSHGRISIGEYKRRVSRSERGLYLAGNATDVLTVVPEVDMPTSTDDITVDVTGSAVVQDIGQQ